MIDVRCKYCRRLLFQADEKLTGYILIRCKRRTCERMVDYTFHQGRSLGDGAQTKKPVALSSQPG